MSVQSIYHSGILIMLNKKSHHLNNRGTFFIGMLCGILNLQNIFAQPGIELQSNRITGVQYLAGVPLPRELLTWGNVIYKGPSIIVAGSKASFEVKIDIKKEIPAGKEIGLFLHFMSDNEPFQTVDSLKSGYLTCISNQADFDIITYANPGVHGRGSFFPYSKYAEIKLKNNAKPGTSFLIKFKDCVIQTYEETLFNIRFAVISDDTMIGYLGDADFEVVGDEMYNLKLFAPTCVDCSETINCKIIVLDKNKNKSGHDLSKLIFNLIESTSGIPLSYGKISYDSDKRYHLVQGLKFIKEGTYYLEASIKGNEKIKGISNPIVVRKVWDERVYFGDLHQHAYLSDGRGFPDANYEYAISTGCIDFLSVMDHQQNYRRPRNFLTGTPMQKGWEELFEGAEKYNGPDLVTIFGTEYGPSRLVGHSNIYYNNLNRENLRKLEKIWDIPEKSINSSFQNFINILQKWEGGYLFLPHAHAGVGIMKYRIPEMPDNMTNVEICSLHGIFEDFYKGWLEEGHLVGVNGGGDNHMTNAGNAKGGYHYPNTNGLAAVYASSKSREQIWNGIKTRKTYAVTSSQHIFLDFSINEARMGEVSNDVQESRKINLEVAGTAPIYKIDLIKNNELIESYGPQIVNNKYIRIKWYDDITGRRVNDSRTTGYIIPQKGTLELIGVLNALNKSDSFVAHENAINFRTNAYSWTARGAIIKSEGVNSLNFNIEDKYLDSIRLKTTIEIDLRKLPFKSKKGLIENYTNMFTSEKGANFYLDADWIDPQSPKTVTLEWEDQGGEEAFYFVRIEQIDGNIAWSSPIWFKK